MKKFHFLLLASAALLPVQAQAQSSDAQVTDPDTITVVASGVEQPISESGRAITVIDRETIERRQNVALSDLLITLPGVNVSRNGGIGNFTGVRIRGAEAEQTLVLIDGVRVNDPSSPAGTFDFGNLLTGAIDRVDVLRGPNSVVWGSQAIGGVVNVVTQSGSDGFHARANAEYGSFNSVSANAVVSGGNESISGALTAGYFHSDGISAAANGTEADGYRQYGVSGRLKANLAPSVSIDLRGYFADSRLEYDSSFPPPNYIVSDSADYSTAREFYGYAGLNADLFDGMLHNRLSFTAGDIHRDNFSAPGTTVSFYGYGSSERYEYQGDLKPANWVRAVFGAEHEESRFTDDFDKANTRSTSEFGEIILTPVEMVTLTGGVRHDDYRSYGSHTTFAASGAVRPIEGMVLRANYAEGFKAPTLYQLFSFFGDTSLQPESSKSYEVGAEQKLFDGKLVLGASWFHRDTTNQIDFDLGTFTYKNIDTTRAEGFELTATVKPVHGLIIDGNFTHVRPENLSSGNVGKDLARRPRDVGSVSADYAFDFGLKLGGTLLVVGDSFDDAGNFNRLKGYTLLSVRAEMAIDKRFTVYGRIENLTDEKYQTVANYGTPGLAAYGGLRLKFD